MLSHLRVANLGVIEEAAIEPDAGLTVITGETGAGKTLLLGGLRLMLGERPDPSAVGPFAEAAQADALFIESDSEIGVTRVVPAEGRSRAHIDGSIVSASTLAGRVGPLVEIVGQHDQMSLRQPSRVLSLIDGSLDAEGARHLDDYRSAWATVQDIRRRQSELGGNEMALRQELDLVRFQSGEIDAASLRQAEDETLENEASRHENVFDMQELLSESLRIADRVTDDIGEMVSRLRRLGSIDSDTSHLARQSEQAAAMVSELMTDLRRSSEGLEADPERAEEVARRLTLIGDLKRKYGATIEEVIGFGAAARARREELEGLLAAAGHLESDLSDALSRLTAAGERLTAARERAAARVADEAIEHLADLGLERARLLVEVGGLNEPGPRGIDQVGILFSSDDHLTPGPISSVASGGELSRLVLAIRLATRAPGAGTLVFDEVDTGVGGSTALALGRKLGELAQNTQVLCVTHLPQVAAFADAHYVVSREGRLARVRRVSGEERLQEISRMLAGLPDSQAGQDTAAELLATAAS